ncbi:MAG: polysaccharide biosynthesis protein, partial [Clostridia bacterium]|nr:polysaccharide biosynthesis protein [Clostridia bacterium]
MISVGAVHCTSFPYSTKTTSKVFDAGSEPSSLPPRAAMEDLLERPEIVIEEQRIGAEITGRTILVTGAAGSIGSEIVRQCCKFAPARLVLLDSAETP